MTTDISKLLQEASESIEQLSKMAHKQDEIIESMKCCWNCKNFQDSLDNCNNCKIDEYEWRIGSDICDSWELRNVIIQN